MDDIDGLSKAQMEKLPDGKQAVVGTFKGLRTFHDERKGTSARMIYRGLVEDDGKLYRVKVPVNVRILIRSAKFKSADTIVAWEPIEDD